MNSLQEISLKTLLKRTVNLRRGIMTQNKPQSNCPDLNPSDLLSLLAESIDNPDDLSPGGDSNSLLGAQFAYPSPEQFVQGFSSVCPHLKGTAISNSGPKKSSVDWNTASLSLGSCRVRPTINPKNLSKRYPRLDLQNYQPGKVIRPSLFSQYRHSVEKSDEPEQTKVLSDMRDKSLDSNSQVGQPGNPSQVHLKKFFEHRENYSKASQDQESSQLGYKFKTFTIRELRNFLQSAN